MALRTLLGLDCNLLIFKVLLLSRPETNLAMVPQNGSHRQIDPTATVG